MSDEQTYNCECGSSIKNNDKAKQRHFNTKKHKEWFELNEPSAPEVSSDVGSQNGGSSSETDGEYEEFDGDKIDLILEMLQELVEGQNEILELLVGSEDMIEEGEEHKEQEGGAVGEVEEVKESESLESSKPSDASA